MRRLYFLIAASLHRNEPVLLVGETGSGKTSVCQSLALALGRQLHIVGCHQNTETADLLGGQRPLRNRASLQASLTKEASELASKAERMIDEEKDFEDVLAEVEELAKGGDEIDVRIRRKAKELADRMRATTALFEWHDGPLVQAMHGGDLILLDEISLADDSVLERLNSVLEPSRTLVLAEKGGRDLSDIQVVGEPGFQILATMNPGGDFGKKELSPALRNRFTEIWVPAVDDVDDLLHIVGKRWRNEQLEPLGQKIIEFAKWFALEIGQTEGLGIGLRDILGWVDFLNAVSAKSRLATLLFLSFISNLPADSFHSFLQYPRCRRYFLSRCFDDGRRWTRSSPCNLKSLEEWTRETSNFVLEVPRNSRSYYHGSREPSARRARSKRYLLNRSFRCQER